MSWSIQRNKLTTISLLLFGGFFSGLYVFAFSGPNFNPPEGLQYAAVVGIAALFFLTYKLYGNGELTARHLNLIVLFSLFFCLLLIRSALLSSDVYNYVFWVKIFTQYHASPYVFTPLAFSSDPFFAVLPPIWLSQPLVYGPLFLVFYFPLQLLAGSDLATNVLLFKLFFILLAVFFYLKRWRAWVLPALMLAAFFKFAPAILLPIAYLSLVRDYPGFKSKLLFTLRSLVAPLVALCVLFSAMVTISLPNIFAGFSRLHHASIFTYLIYFLFPYKVKLPVENVSLILLSLLIFIGLYLYALMRKIQSDSGLAEKVSFALLAYLFFGTFWVQAWYFIWVIPLMLTVPKAHYLKGAFWLSVIYFVGYYTYGAITPVLAVVMFPALTLALLFFLGRRLA